MLGASNEVFDAPNELLDPPKDVLDTPKVALRHLKRIAGTKGYNE